MKKIICYGDSNTFGFNTADNSRFDENTRWTSVLQKKLGTEYEVINEGMCDRTGFVINPKGFIFSAPKHFPELILQTGDIDILILWVGTNDLQFKYDLTIHQFENGLEKLIVMAKDNVRRIILIPPVILSDNVLEGNFNFQFNSTSIVKSKKVGKIYRKLSNLYGLDYFDLNNFVKPSNVDGLHYDSEGHNIISTKLSDYIKSIYA